MINYCNQCGAPVSERIPPGDNRPRHICDFCGHIQYRNPKVVCGCLPIWGERVLLCKRAIDPRKGLWTLPAGFMENGETLKRGAARETMEEACAAVTDMRLFGVYSIPAVHQVYVMFIAELIGEDRFAAGDESLEVRLFAEAEIPWDEIAFRVIDRTLKRYFAMRGEGEFAVVVEDVL